jgi:hypothetical protein
VDIGYTGEATLKKITLERIQMICRLQVNLQYLQFVMDNPEKLGTLDTQGTGRRQNKNQKTPLKVVILE